MRKASASIFVCAGLLGVTLLVPRPAAAGPDTGDGVPICVATMDQSVPKIVSDAAGGAIVTWQDSRSGNADIYVQRISADGTPQWTTDGVALCTAIGDQSVPTITSDGAGGAIVTWNDYRNGYQNNDIYAQRISADGAVMWTANGVALCTAIGGQYGPTITSDGAGGAIVTWQDPRSANADIYAQRISADGTPQWTADGVALCTAIGDQSVPTITSDGAGGAIVTWTDERGGYPDYNYDIYVQRISADGTVQWTANGVALCTAIDYQYGPTITSDGAGGAIVTWTDQRGRPNVNIYVQRISAAGTVQWASNGVALCTAGSSPVIAPDDAGGAIVTWYGWGGLYAQRISADGTVPWPVNGVALCTGNQNGATITSDGAGGAIVTWQDGRSGIPETYYHDIYAQRISAAGTVQWAANGVALCTATGEQTAPAIASDGAGGAIVAWQDGRAGQLDVFAQRVKADASGFWLPTPTILDVADVSADQGGRVVVEWEASFLDLPSSYGVKTYSIWRQVPSGASTGGAAPIGTDMSATKSGAIRTTVEGAQTLYWEYLASQPARRLPGYSYVAATTTDSMAGSNPYTRFMVLAETEGGFPYWASAPDSGYSVDNLSPAQPAPFAALYGPGAGVALHWGTNTESDLRGYRVYRGASPSFIPGPSNLVVAQPDTGFYDASGSLAFSYKLSAIDIHGNESRYALVTAEGATGALASLLSAEVEGTVVRLRWLAAANPGLSAAVYRRTAETAWTVLGQVSADGTGIMAWNDAQVICGQSYGYRLGIWDGATEAFLGETWVEVPTLTFALEGVRPNPSRGAALLVSFSLPSDRPARLELFDLGGRRLLAREVGSMGPGQHRLDVGAGTTLRAGMYVLRLTQGQESRSLKAVVVR